MTKLKGSPLSGFTAPRRVAAVKRDENLMMDDWEKAKKIFGDAIKLAPDERLRFLDDVCADDADTRREVESLLASFNKAESFMENPAVGEVAELLVAENCQLTDGQNFGRYEIIRQIDAGGKSLEK